MPGAFALTTVLVLLFGSYVKNEPVKMKMQPSQVHKAQNCNNEYCDRLQLTYIYLV